MTFSRRRLVKAAALGAGGLLPVLPVAPVGAAGSEGRRAALTAFIDGMPKAELHVHLEGTVEPAVALRIAARNGVAAPYDSVEDFEAALGFDSLASFLKAFDDTIAVLRTEEDFYDITLSYLEKCARQTIVHAEIKFDPQAHLRRGIPYEAFMAGIGAAQDDGEERFGVHSKLIMCFQRDAPLTSAEAAFEAAIARMLELGLRVTVSTDDPGVMGNRYLNEVMLDAAAYSSLDAAQLGRLGLNSLESAWTTVERRQAYLSRMASYLAQAS